MVTVVTTRNNIDGLHPTETFALHHSVATEDSAYNTSYAVKTLVVIVDILNIDEAKFNNDLGGDVQVDHPNAKDSFYGDGWLGTTPQDDVTFHAVMCTQNSNNKCNKVDAALFDIVHPEDEANIKFPYAIAKNIWAKDSAASATQFIARIGSGSVDPLRWKVTPSSTYTQVLGPVNYWFKIFSTSDDVKYNFPKSSDPCGTSDQCNAYDSGDSGNMYTYKYTVTYIPSNTKLPKL
jgi:hypothetical protein